MAAVILDEYNPHGDNIVVIPTGGGDTPPHFEGLTNPTINQGTEFDPTEGVRALDKDGNEVSYTVEPDEIDTCEKGNHTLTYTAGETTATRIVTVQTIDDPTISGADLITVEVGEEFDPLDGVSAVDGNGNEVEVTYEEPEPPEQYVIMVDVSNYTAPNSIPTQSAYWQYEALEYEVEGVLADGVPATVTGLTTDDDAVIHLHFGDEFVVSLHDRYNATFTSTVSGANPPNEVTFERLIIKYLEH